MTIRTFSLWFFVFLVNPVYATNKGSIALGTNDIPYNEYTLSQLAFDFQSLDELDSILSALDNLHKYSVVVLNIDCFDSLPDVFFSLIGVENLQVQASEIKDMDSRILVLGNLVSFEISCKSIDHITINIASLNSLETLTVVTTQRCKHVLTKEMKAIRKVKCQNMENFICSINNKVFECT